MLRCTLIARDARGIGFALREDDVVDGLIEWASLMRWADIELNYWVASDYEDAEDPRVVSYASAPLLDYLRRHQEQT